jgi:hypothetical protein
MFKLPMTYTDIVNEIVKFTSLSREEVEHRVYMPALQPGLNVLQDRLPTHLKVNSKYLGKAPFLFWENKMLLSWYSRHPLCKPMEFVKVTRTYLRDRFSLLSDFHVRSNYLSRYMGKLAHFIDKLAYLGNPYNE